MSWNVSWKITFITPFYSLSNFRQIFTVLFVCVCALFHQNWLKTGFEFPFYILKVSSGEPYSFLCSILFCHQLIITWFLSLHLVLLHVIFIMYLFLTLLNLQRSWWLLDFYLFCSRQRPCLLIALFKDTESSTVTYHYFTNLERISYL